ncbi:MAG: AmmeMemoRadiSam system protein B [Desulforhopalus sp.]
MRQPAVADRFYPGSPEALTKAITKLFPPTQNTKRHKALAVVSPHAGYIYSGALAAETFWTVEIPETVIILGPNHHGHGVPIALSTDTWEMPLGTVPVNREIADRILKHSSQIQIDERAHTSEHSLEVQVPFLQVLQKNLHIVPIAISQISYTLCEDVAQSLAKVIQDSKKELLIVASSDMSHYLPRRIAEAKDRSALSCLERLEPYELYRTVFDNRISMCGVIPVVIALLAAKACGATQSMLVGYTDSGYISGDTDQVVGYAGAVIS